MKKAELELRNLLLEKLDSKESNVIYINNDKFKINPNPVKKYKHLGDLSFEEKSIEKLKKYDPLLLKAYKLLLPQNRISFISLLEVCNIPEDVKVIRVLSDEDIEESMELSRKLILTVSKGQLYAKQENWMQTTELKMNIKLSDKKVFKDKDAIKHIRIVLDIEVPPTVLRQIVLNAKKQVPIIETLTGFEPYNLLDMTNEEYTKQRNEANVKSIIYAERYEEHIKLLSNLSPYQAGNAFLLLQADLNLMVQKAIHLVLSKGHKITPDLLIHYSFDTLADATKDLFIKYHAPETTDKDRIKIKRFIALYFAVVEEAQNNVENYIESLCEKYNINKDFAHA